jgi:hypothetical protein
MNCACHDDHPFVLFGTLIGDNCVGLTTWGWVFYFGMILALGGIVIPLIHYGVRR